MTEMLSDTEHEAIIRERLRLHPRHRCLCDACVLSRRLDEARTSAAPPVESLSKRVERERPRSRWLDNLGKERLARIEELRATIRKCDEAIEAGTYDSWHKIDRDSARQELDNLLNARV
jgi:hypothetical protein